MQQINTKVKKWGNSFGIVLPMEIIKKQQIKEGTGVNVTISAQNKMTVGDLMESIKQLNLPKIKKPTEKIMKEIDKELWNERW
jgi:antitoxin component of MazEF toxin-antitoxin module